MSTSSYAQAILAISQQFTIYSSVIILALGLIGNIVNIIIFSGLKLFRGNQCVFYIIVQSIFDCGTLLIEFTSRIDLSVYQYDLTLISLFWCKMRAMLLQICVMTSLITVCFLSIDQYLSTNPRYDLRQLSTLKLAQRVTFINICLWILHSIPFGIFYDIQPMTVCTRSNQVFKLYYSFVYLLILNGILPLTTSLIFSILSYNNVRRIIRRQMPIVRRKLDRQLTAMVLARIAFLIIVSIPFGFFFIYTLNVSTDANDSVRVAVHQLIFTVTSTFYYINYAGSFYLYWLSSTRFRRQTYYFFVTKLWRKISTIQVIQSNKVTPVVRISNKN